MGPAGLDILPKLNYVLDQCQQEGTTDFKEREMCRTNYKYEPSTITFLLTMHQEHRDPTLLTEECNLLSLLLLALLINNLILIIRSFESHIHSARNLVL